MKRLGPLEFDETHLVLRARRRPVHLPPMALRLLAALLERDGEVVSKAELMDLLWPDGFVEEGNLTQYVYLLRRELARHGLAGVIETHPRRGYALRLPASSPSSPPPAKAFPWKAVATFVLIAVMSLVGPAPPRTVDAETTRLYALGQYYFNLRTPDAMHRSIAYFADVIAREPNRALGYAAMADSYIELADFEQPCNRCEQWKRNATVLARIALDLEPQNADAHVANAMVARITRGDDRTAERELRYALTVDSANTLAHQWLGNLLVVNGQLEEGRRELTIAASRQPVATATLAWLARANYYLRNYAQAERYAMEALQLDPARMETLTLLVLTQQARGEVAAASRTCRRIAALGAQTQAAILDSAVAAASKQNAGVEASLRRLAATDPYARRDLIVAYAIIGDRDAARATLRNTKFAMVLDRQLLELDPHVAPLLSRG